MKQTTRALGSQWVWVVAAVLTQFVWGFFPVLCRYFQTQSDHPLSSLELSFLVNGIGAGGLLLFYSLPKHLQLWAQARRERQKNPCIAFPAAAAAAAAAVAAAASGGAASMPRTPAAPAGQLLGEAAAAGSEGISPEAAGMEPRAAPPALRLRTRATHARLVASAPATPFSGPASAGRQAPSLLEDIAAALSPRYWQAGAGSNQFAPVLTPAAAPAVADLEAAGDGALLLAGAQPQTAGPAGLETHLPAAPGSPAAAAAGAEGGGRGRALLKRPSLLEDTASSQPELQEMVRASLRMAFLHAQLPWPFTPPARAAPHRPPQPLSLPSSPQALGARWAGQHPAPRQPSLPEPYPCQLPESRGALPGDWSPLSQVDDSAELRQPLLPAAQLDWRSEQLASEGLQGAASAAVKESSAAGAVEGVQGYPYASTPPEYAAQPEYAPQEEYALLHIQYGPPHHWLTPYALASISAAALAALALGLIFSVRFTQAHWCQLVFMLSPLLVAFICKWLFSMPLPQRLWPALALTLTGSAMVLLAKAAPGVGRDVLTWHDALGLSLALVSAFSLAAYMVLVQCTKGLLSEEDILWINYGVQIVLPLALCLLLEPARLRVLLQLSSSEWEALAGVGLVVHTGANLLQQLTIRRLGAPTAATFLGMRVLGSISLSWPLLGERVESGWEWVGVALVLATVTWYLLVQRGVAAREDAAAAAGPAAAAAVGE